MAGAHPAPDGLRGGEARRACSRPIEPRRLRQGDLVAMGEAEDGTEGIVVHAEGFLGGGHGANEFRFMSTEVSRERPVNYEELAARVGEEKRRGGYLVWVVGPGAGPFARAGRLRVVHPERLRPGGACRNAVAVHDIEAAIFGTTLGMTNTGQPTEGGHGLHMRAINRVRAAGSIERAVETGLIKSGIMHALVTQRVPYVLAGSIRDDGPLPGVYSDTLAAQDAMREHTVKATGAIFVATALHAIAVGNMLPAFYLGDGAPAPLMTICVDQTEFVVNKLKDRGTHQAYGVVTNAQDFMHVLRFYTERWEQGARRDRRRAGWARLAAAVAEQCRPRRWTASGSSARCGTRAGSGARRCSPGSDGDRRRIYTARYMLAIKGKERGKFEASVAGGRQRAGRGAGQLLQDAQRRIDDEQPPHPGAARALVRGRRRCPASLAARARPSSTAFAATSAIIASRSPASAIWSPRSCCSPTITCRSTASGARSRSGRARRHRHGVPHPRSAGGERPGPGPRLRRGVQALRAHAGPGRPRAPDLRALRPGGRVPERAARADAADHRRRARLPASAPPGGDLRRVPGVPPAGARRRCERACHPRAVSSPSPPGC